MNKTILPPTAPVPHVAIPAHLWVLVITPVAGLDAAARAELDAKGRVLCRDTVRL